MDETSFPYAILEATLARFFLPEGDILTFRARLKNLQRLGLAKTPQGKGNHQEYTYSDLCDYALALMLAEFGLEPRRIVQQVRPGEAASERKGTGSYCVYYPEWFTKGFSNLQYMDAKAAMHLAITLPRLAIINLEEMKRNLRADLFGILSKGD